MCQDFFYGFNASCPTCSPTLHPREEDINHEVMTILQKSNNSTVPAKPYRPTLGTRQTSSSASIMTSTTSSSSSLSVLRPNSLKRVLSNISLRRKNSSSSLPSPSIRSSSALSAPTSHPRADYFTESLTIGIDMDVGMDPYQYQAHNNARKPNSGSSIPEEEWANMGNGLQ